MTTGIVNEKNLLRLSIIVSLVGLLFLYLYATEISFEPINKIDIIPVDSTVTVQGRVSNNYTHHLLNILNASWISVLVQPTPNNLA
jgi:hypothetical protein